MNNLLKKIICKMPFRKKPIHKCEYAYPSFRKKRRKPYKVRILGDHSGLHCGCKAVIDSLSEAVTLKGWNSADAFQPYDILIVNGEGSMHPIFLTFIKKFQF